METQSDNNTFEAVTLDTDSYHCREEAYENQLDDDGMYEDNEYIQSLFKSADLHLHQTDLIDKQLEENKMNDKDSWYLDSCVRCFINRDIIFPAFCHKKKQIRKLYLNRDMMGLYSPNIG